MTVCRQCGGPVKGDLVPRYDDQLMGIKVVLLNSVTQKQCQECGETSIKIPHLEGLIAAVAVTRVVRATKLNGAEIKFLRKALDITSKTLAELLEVREESVSRWENGKEVIRSSTEKLLRTVAGYCLSKRAPGVDFDIQSIIEMKINPVRDDLEANPMEFELMPVKVERQSPAPHWSTLIKEAA